LIHRKRCGYLPSTFVHLHCAHDTSAICHACAQVCDLCGHSFVLRGSHCDYLMTQTFLFCLCTWQPCAARLWHRALQCCNGPCWPIPAALYVCYCTATTSTCHAALNQQQLVYASGHLPRQYVSALCACETDHIVLVILEAFPCCPCDSPAAVYVTHLLPSM